MKLFYEYIVIFFNLSPTSNHLHSLRVANRGSNSRLVVDEDDYGKFRIERVLTRRHDSSWPGRVFFNGYIPGRHDVLTTTC